MREELRQSCSDIWVIDCSPEGHQPEVATRIFQGVQQQICIVLAARKRGCSATDPAHVRYYPLPSGRRGDKFLSLDKLSLYSSDWVDCSDSWRSSFLPAAEGAWADFLPLKDVFIYNGSGVMPGRTWVIAPDRSTLESRWTRLITEEDKFEKEKLFHPHEGGDKTSTKGTAKGLAGHEVRLHSINSDKSPVIKPVRYAYRTLDRQWIIPDNRLINRANPKLWNSYSSSQFFLTAPESSSPKNGPAISFSAHIPDLDHYAGRGGRIYPLWFNRSATQPNIRPALLEQIH